MVVLVVVLVLMVVVLVLVVLRQAPAVVVCRVMHYSATCMSLTWLWLARHCSRACPTRKLWQLEEMPAKEATSRRKHTMFVLMVMLVLVLMVVVLMVVLVMLR